jgi:hypothetical protein
VGYVTVTAGTTITAAWANSNVRDQVVSQFATAAARDSAITAPVEGMVAHLADLDLLTVYQGGGWKYLPKLLGGTRWTGGGNMVTGLTTTELAIMTASAAVTIPPASAVEVSVGIRCSVTVNGSTFIFRLRESNAAGAQRGEYAWTNPVAATGYNEQFRFAYENVSASSESKTWCVTAQRSAGTGELTMIAGPAIHNVHITTTLLGSSGIVTNSASP